MIYTVLAHIQLRSRYASHLRAKTAAYVGSILMSMLPFPVAAIAGEVGAEALEGGMAPELIAVRKFLGYASLGHLMFTVGKIGLHAAKAAIHYVMKHGFVGTIRNLWNGAKSLARGAWNWLERKVLKTRQSCGCFAAGTVVWTMSGLVPIDHINVGDYVVARDEQSGMVQFAPVTDTIVTPGAALVEVAVEHANGRVDVIQTTDEHPFWVHKSADTGAAPTLKTGMWRRADELSPGLQVGTLLGPAVVRGVSFGSERQTVFNLSVKDLGTFHVGTDGVLVHNCTWAGEHHLIPKYMGMGESATTFLTHAQHVELHRLIDAAGKSRGIPTRSAGTHEVATWARRNQYWREELYESLYEAYSKFDINHGTRLMDDLRSAVNAFAR